MINRDVQLDGLSDEVLHDEVVPARAAWLHHVKAGQTLRIVDLEGNQAVDFLLYAAADDAERYSAQDTVAAQGNLFLREGTVSQNRESSLKPKPGNWNSSARSCGCSNP